MSTNQTTPSDIETYIAGFPADVQAVLQAIRKTVRAAAPDAEEAIKYQMPTFTLHGNLVHFAAFKKHIGFYPSPRDGAELQEELARYAAAKGTLRFPLDEPMPLELIRRVVQLRVEEQLEKVKGCSVPAS